jgi:hypothetical protein
MSSYCALRCALGSAGEINDFLHALNYAIGVIEIKETQSQGCPAGATREVHKANKKESEEIKTKDEAEIKLSLGLRTAVLIFHTQWLLQHCTAKTEHAGQGKDPLSPLSRREACGEASERRSMAEILWYSTQVRLASFVILVEQMLDPTVTDTRLVAN